MATGKRLDHRKQPAGKDVLWKNEAPSHAGGDKSVFSLVLSVGNVFRPDTNTRLPKAAALHPQSLAGGRGSCRACPAPPAPGPKDQGTVPCSKLEYPCDQHTKAQHYPKDPACSACLHGNTPKLIWSGVLKCSSPFQHQEAMPNFTICGYNNLVVKMKLHPCPELPQPGCRAGVGSSSARRASLRRHTENSGLVLCVDKHTFRTSSSGRMCLTACSVRTYDSHFNL